jgi:tripeptide aminopeptidase
MQHIIDRFIGYVTVDTESDPESNTTPSTAKQWDLAHKLVEELKQIGLSDVSIDDKSYVMATLPSNLDYEVPTIGFVSHFDTTPDFTGKDVKPKIIRNYDGGDIVLNKEK